MEEEPSGEEPITKRLRMEAEIVERVKQGLPLTNDAMNYLLAKFDLDSLKRLSATSWTMREFFKNNQVWRRKFIKLIDSKQWGSVLDMSREQWISYWDLLANGPCPEQYRLLVAFVSFLESRTYMTMMNPRTRVRFSYAREFASVAHYVIPFVRGDDLFVYKDDMHTQLTKSEVKDENGRYHYLLDEFFLIDWDYYYYDEALYPNVTETHNDSITITYNLLGLGYLPHEREGQTYRPISFATVASFIGNDAQTPDQALCCAQCLQRDATEQCGHKCGAAFYCGQSCAETHWNVHEMECVGARAWLRKGGDAKVHKVMREFKEGHLHSGSKKGPIVKNRKQAIAIALAEARRGK